MSRRAVGLWLAMTLTPACGSSGGGAAVDGSGVDGGSDGAADAAIDGPAVSDGPLASSDDGGCQQVCWRTVPRLANPEEGETETFVSDECRCPDGYACTGTQTISTGVSTLTGLGALFDPAAEQDSTPTGRGTATYRVCQAIDPQNPPALVVDFRDDVPVVPVTLRFRRSGGAWPASATAGSAGEITLTPYRPQAPVVLSIPTSADGALPVMLPQGRYGVRLQMGRGPSFDPFTYPISTLEGELTVERAGEAIIDVPATPFTFDFRVGGAPFPVPRPGQTLAVRIEGRYGVPSASSNLFAWKRQPGQALDRRTIWLEPGKYTVTVVTEGWPTDPNLPIGFVIPTRFLEIGTEPVERTFDFQIFKLTGAITIDGKDLAPDVVTEVDLAAKDAALRVEVGPTRPAQYSLLAYGGTYDVALNTGTGGESLGTPSGALRIAQQKVVDQDLALPIAVTTTPWSAELTVNGAPLADAAIDRGTLALAGSESHSFGLGKMGAALVSGRVYQSGPALVRVVGAAGGPLPSGEMTVASDFTPTGAPAKFDLVLAPVTIGLHIDGVDPPASTAARGLFRFTRADDPTAGAAAAASMDGPLVASVALPPGTWKATFRSAADAPGMPVGDLALPDLVVPPEGLSHTFDVASVGVVVELRRDGAPLADASGTKDRGAVQVGSSRLRLPRTGPARMTMRAFPGVLSVATVCDDTCGAGLPPFVTPVPRLQVGP